VYLHRLMEQIGYVQNSSTLIAQDNMACIYLTQGARMYHKVNHIDTSDVSGFDNPPTCSHSDDSGGVAVFVPSRTPRNSGGV
jgi:hypothetical protein